MGCRVWGSGFGDEGLGFTVFIGFFHIIGLEGLGLRRFKAYRVWGL